MLSESEIKANREYYALYQRVSDVYDGARGDWTYFCGGLQRALLTGFILMNVEEPINRNKDYVVTSITRYLLNNGVRA